VCSSTQCHSTPCSNSFLTALPQLLPLLQLLLNFCQLLFMLRCHALLFSQGLFRLLLGLA
jgi:hypothetical protein